MTRSEELRQEALDAGRRADQSKSLREAVTHRKRQRALDSLASNEEWLEGKSGSQTQSTPDPA